MTHRNSTDLEQNPILGEQAPHDHRVCMDDALKAAEMLAKSRGMRLTDNRVAVLMSIWSDHRAHKAYEILETLAAKRPGIKPPTVYRALDFLTELGLIHRIESLNAYVGCPDPDHPHEGAFLICDSCGRVEELSGSALRKSVGDAAAKHKFHIRSQTIEAHGECEPCRTGHTS